MLFSLLSFVVLSSLAPLQTPASVAEKFCRMELSGIGLDGRTSQPLLDLTVGDEEPFSDQYEIASACKAVQTKNPSSSSAEVVLEYQVIGTIEEDGHGKRIVPAHREETVKLQLVLVDGAWKVARKSLGMPMHAKAKAWAKLYQDTLDANKEPTDHDRNLRKVIAELRNMSDF